MKVVITGGAGFIGHHLATFLKDRGYEVTCIDNLYRASEDALRILKDAGISLISVDICDYRRLYKAIKELNPDAVVHSAALISVDESFKRPDIYLRCNTLGTLYVAKACLECKVSRLIYISTAAVYGDPVKLPIAEDHPLNPKSPYGLSKLFGEEVVKFYSRAYGLNYVVLRLFNVYGPRQPLSEYAGVITKFIERVNAGLPPIIYGDGTQVRDFIHVKDVCRAIEKSLTTQHVNEVYNVGSGDPVSINDLAKLVLKLKRMNMECLYAPPRPGDIRASYASIDRARALLRWRPRVDLEDGIRRTVDWFLGTYRNAGAPR